MLRVFGIEPSSVFGILSRDENSATFALGWVLERSPAFLTALVQELTQLGNIKHADTAIELQRHEINGGFTDIELMCRGKCHIIIEAKRSWTLPDRSQLEKYCHRLSAHENGVRRIASLSAASREYANRHLPEQIGDIPLSHRSWGDLRRIVIAAHATTKSFEEKLWLRELGEHLAEYVLMRNPRDNLVYVVSLSDNSIQDGSGYTWIDVVEKQGRYFHPVGNRWPVLPPNYIAFRYYGRVQSVHHIADHEVATNPASVDPRWANVVIDHFVYTLGPAMRPMTEVRTGNIFRNARVWCAIDTLLSGAHRTVSEARDETKRRLNAMA